MLGFFKNIFRRLKSSMNQEKYLKRYGDLINVLRRVTPLTPSDLETVHIILQDLVADQSTLDKKMEILKNALKMKGNVLNKRITKRIEIQDLNRDKDVTYCINGMVVYGEVESEEETKYFSQDNVQMLNSMPLKPKMCDFECARNECKYCLEKRLRIEIYRSFEIDQQANKKRKVSSKVVKDLNQKLGLPSVFGRYVADEKFDLDDLEENEKKEFLIWKSEQKGKTALARKTLKLDIQISNEINNKGVAKTQTAQLNIPSSGPFNAQMNMVTDQLGQAEQDNQLNNYIKPASFVNPFAQHINTNNDTLFNTSGVLPTDNKVSFGSKNNTAHVDATVEVDLKKEHTTKDSTSVFNLDLPKKCNNGKEAAYLQNINSTPFKFGDDINKDKLPQVKHINNSTDLSKKYINHMETGRCFKEPSQPTNNVFISNSTPHLTTDLQNKPKAGEIERSQTPNMLLSANLLNTSTINTQETSLKDGKGTGSVPVKAFSTDSALKNPFSIEAVSSVIPPGSFNASINTATVTTPFHTPFKNNFASVTKADAPEIKFKADFVPTLQNNATVPPNTIKNSFSGSVKSEIEVPFTITQAKPSYSDAAITQNTGNPVLFNLQTWSNTVKPQPSNSFLNPGISNTINTNPDKGSLLTPSKNPFAVSPMQQNTVQPPPFFANQRNNSFAAQQTVPAAQNFLPFSGSQATSNFNKSSAFSQQNNPFSGQSFTSGLSSNFSNQNIFQSNKDGTTEDQTNIFQNQDDQSDIVRKRKAFRRK